MTSLRQHLLRCLLLTLVCAAVQVAQPAAQSAAVLAGNVTRVIDGDTIDVLLASGSIRVRLHAVDAPESGQSGGTAATAWLRRELQGRQVMLEPVSQDQYERMVAIVHLEDRNMNRELVAAGHAWAYRQYMQRSDEALCALEATARLERAGIWATTAVAPWEYRATQGKGPFRDYSRSTSADCRSAIGTRQS